MGKRVAFRCMLLLTCIATTRGQYFDLFQGAQQFFQPFQQPNNYFSQGNDVTRLQNVQRHNNRQENKKNPDNNDSSHLKKQTVSQFDYIFSTTPKPSKKSRPNSSHSNSRNNNNNNNKFAPSFNFNDNFTPSYDTTTKKRKTSTTTTESYPSNYNNRNNYKNNRPTTENIFNNGASPKNYEVISSITENVFGNNHRKENYETYYQTPVANENYNYRQPNNYYNNAVVGNDYNTKYQSTPDNNRNPNDQFSNRGEFGNQNRGLSNNNQPNTYNSRNTNNNNWVNPSTFSSVFSNTGLSNGNFEDSPSYSNSGVGNNYNRGTSNNRGTNFDSSNNSNNNRWNTNNNRGTLNSNSNNRGVYNDRGNSNNKWNTNVDGNVNNREYDNNNRGNSNNKGSSGDRGFIYPDNPLINRPGVKPAPVDPAGPPITNRPVTEDSIGFGSNPGSEYDDKEPEILIGPDEDDMSDTQKRRYIEMAEKMCDRYKALDVKKVVALPLVPSPHPVEVNVTECTPLNVPLVIGGKVVTINEFPHMALVGWRKDRTPGYSWKCGGSLISDKYILTAGHCSFQDKDYDVISGPPQAVQLGSSYLDDPGAMVVKVAAVIRHPKYKQRRSYHDVAMIKMARKVTFSEVIRPACIGVPPPVGRKIIATGWGRTEFGGDHSLELRSVSLPIWDMRSCREIWGTSLKLPQGVTADSHVCAGDDRGGKDTCQGDSGGPAQLEDGCAWRVVAVTSLGRSCGAPGTPALYATIPRAFVAAQILDNKD